MQIASLEQHAALQTTSADCGGRIDLSLNYVIWKEKTAAFVRPPGFKNITKIFNSVCGDANTWESGTLQQEIWFPRPLISCYRELSSCACTIIAVSRACMTGVTAKVSGTKSKASPNVCA